MTESLELKSSSEDTSEQLQESIIPKDAVLVDTAAADALVEEKLREPIIEPMAPPYRIVLWFRYDDLRAAFDLYWEQNSESLIKNLGVKGKKSKGGEMPSGKGMVESTVPLKRIYQSVLVERLRDKVPEIFYMDGMELFNFEKGQDPHLIAIVYFHPKLELKVPINWACKRPKEPSRKEQYEQRLRELQMQFRKLEDDPDGTITETSNIQMDITASIDGNPYVGGSVQSQWVDISGIPLKDLSAQLIGHKVGDLFEVDYLANPRDPGAAGKTVHAIIKIHNLQKIIMPPVDDDLAKDAEFDDLKSFEARFNQDFEGYLLNMRRAVSSDHLIGHIVQNSKIPPIPQGWLDLVVKSMSDEHIKRFNGNRKAAMKAIGANTEDDFKHRFTGQAYRELMQDLSMRKYCEMYNLELGSDAVFDHMLDNIKWIEVDILRPLKQTDSW